MSELKPCPFCGAHDDEGEHQHTESCYFSARDRLLNAKNSDLSEVPAVLRGWNMRTTQADQVLVPRELLARVEESLRCEIEERYAGTKDHPAIRPKYLRDIAEADELRTILHP